MPRSWIDDAEDELRRNWPYWLAGAAAVGLGAYAARRILDPVPGTVFVIIEENHGYSQTIGNSALPYYNSLANQYASLTNYHTTYHPSLPNYLIMTSGSSWGITDDAYHLIDSQGQDLFAQMIAANIPWRAYGESMGSACNTSDSSVYATRHVPAIYYSSVINSGSCGQYAVDLSQLPADLAADNLKFVFITPNLQNDWHDGTAQMMDAWLQQYIPLLVGSAGYQRGGAIFVLMDESNIGSQIPGVIVSENLKQKPMADATPYDQRSVCAAIQDLLGLPRLAATTGVSSFATLF